MIEISEDIEVAYPVPLVWQLVSDPKVVVSCIAGASIGDEAEDGYFPARILIKSGALRVGFTSKFRVDFDENSLTGTVVATSKDSHGGTRAKTTANFEVVESGRQNSVVRMRGQVDLSGKLASIIEASAGVVVKRMMREFIAEFVKKCALIAQPSGTGQWIFEPESSIVMAAYRQLCGLVRVRETVTDLTGQAERGEDGGTNGILAFRLMGSDAWAAATASVRGRDNTVGGISRPCVQVKFSSVPGDDDQIQLNVVVTVGSQTRSFSGTGILNRSAGDALRLSCRVPISWTVNGHGSRRSPVFRRKRTAVLLLVVRMHCQGSVAG